MKKLHVMTAAMVMSFASMQAVPASAATPSASVLQQRLTQWASQVSSGQLGVAVLDLTTHASAVINASEAFPMMSVFKAPLGAVVLAQIDAGKLRFDQQVTIERKDVTDGAAVPSIGAHFKGARMRFTVDQLLHAAVSESDNTAADALLRLVGGGPVVTTFLRTHGIDGMRVDIGEDEVSRIFEQSVDADAQAKLETPAQTDARLQRGYQAYLHDPRNHSTPDAALSFLQKLWQGQLLSTASTQKLIALLDAQTQPNRIRAGLPVATPFADKCGTSTTLDGRTAAYNDIGIMRLPNHHVVLVAAFLSDTAADKAQRDALFAHLGHLLSATP